MSDGVFTIKIPNLEKIKSAFARYPEIAETYYQKAIVGTQAIFAQNTHRLDPVPVRTGTLFMSFEHRISRLRAAWGPTARYAPFVAFGTAAHAIMPRNKPFLAWHQGGVGARYVTSKSGRRYRKGPSGGDWVYTSRGVWHPGTKANPFMERILEKSTPGVLGLFEIAADNVLKEVANQAS